MVEPDFLQMRPAWLPVGPAVMYAFFRFASVPLMDKRSLARRPGYSEVMATVPAMAPLNLVDLFKSFKSLFSAPSGGDHQKGA